MSTYQSSLIDQKRYVAAAAMCDSRPAGTHTHRSTIIVPLADVPRERLTHLDKPVNPHNCIWNSIGNLIIISLHFGLANEVTVCVL